MGIVEAEHDPLNIEFQPTNFRDGAAFRSLLECEMKLRNIPFLARSSTQQLRITLAEILLIEKSFNLVSEGFEATNFNEAMIRLEQSLPCLLPLENRSSETLIEHLLHQGFKLREDNPLLTKQLIQDVERIMNEEIFRQIGCRSNWKFPVNDDGSMGQIKFANWRARRVIEKIHSLIELCIPGNEEEQHKWREVISAYQSTIQVCSQLCLLILFTIIVLLLMNYLFFLAETATKGRFYTRANT